MKGHLRIDCHKLLKCDFCHKTGHLKIDCFRLIGYPPNYKGKRDTVGGMAANSTYDAGPMFSQQSAAGTVFSQQSAASQHTCPPPYYPNQYFPYSTPTPHVHQSTPMFTPGQHEQLLKMLDQATLTDTSGVAHMAGNSPSSTNDSITWIVDTGASNHMIGDSKHLHPQGLIENAGHVQLPTGANTAVSHLGNCHLTGGDVLRKVLCVPTFKFNLMSVSKVTQDLNCCVTFFPCYCVFQDLLSGKVRGIGKEEDGLYTLCSQIADKADTRPPQNCLAAIQGNDTNADTWHQRLCHVPINVIKKIPSFHRLGSTFVLHKCEVCPLARQTRLPFPHSISKSSCIFQLVHLDVWGPYKLETYDGMRYFLTIVDDYSRCPWTFLMRLKSDVISLLKNFFVEVETQFDTKIKKVRSDNGSEFFNHNCNDLFKLHGVVHESTCPYTPQQHGVVERRHRHILETARAIKFQAGFPDRFWGLCIQAAVYVINRIPSTSLGNKSPFEKLYGKQPSFHHMRVIGSLCFATNLTKQDKLSPRAVRSALVGYGTTQKGYKLYDLENKTFFVSRDVVFLESVFPFKESITDQQNKLSTQDLFAYDDLITAATPPLDNVSAQNIDQLSPGSSASSMENPTLVSVVPDIISSPPIRRSTRGARPPIWHKDYIIKSGTSNCLYSIASVLDYAGLSPRYQSFIARFSAETEPGTYAEAAKDPRWMEAMQNEIQALEDNKTWKLVELPKDKKAIGCRWVYKIKYKADGKVERFKARLVAKGYNQKEGFDYQETFSPVVKMATVRSVVSIAAANHWQIHQMDVYNAFLQGDLYEEVYMNPPEGFSGNTGNNQVCRLFKSLYGLKQASRQWNIKFTTTLTDSGFQQSTRDYSLFTKRKDDKLMVILIYVDDLLLTGNDSNMIQETKEILQHAFKIKDLGELRYFLGLEFGRNKDGILIHQRKYALELIADMGLAGARPVSTPMELNQKLTSVEFDANMPSSHSDAPLKDPTGYQRLIGRLLYLTTTRPDISFAVQCLSQFMHSPKTSHMDATLRLVRYIKSAPGLGILMSSTGKNDLKVFCDADWGSCINSRRSITGYLI